MEHRRSLEFSVKLAVQFKDEDGYVIARSPDLDVCSQGGNKEEATHNLVEAVQLFLESCYRRGVLDETLHECGFQPAEEIHKQSMEEADEVVNVPLPLLAQRSKDALNQTC